MKRFDQQLASPIYEKEEKVVVFCFQPSMVLTRWKLQRTNFAC